MKIYKPLTFIYLLKRDVVRNMKIITEVYPLSIEGQAVCDMDRGKYDRDRYAFNLEKVSHEGTDLSSLFHFLSEYESDIEDEAYKYIPELFEPCSDHNLFDTLTNIVKTDVKNRYNIDL